jgi:hypothetical protein
MTRVALLAVVVAATVALDAGLVRELDVHHVLTPAPGNVVRNFITAMHAGRFAVARQQLDERARSRVTVDDLRRADQALRREHGDYRLAAGGGGDDERYEGTLETASGAGLRLSARLQRDPRTRLLKLVDVPSPLAR